jgi:hypothetical protein
VQTPGAIIFDKRAGLVLIKLPVVFTATIALGRGDPDIGATCIEINVESLGWIAHRDGTDILK